MLPLGKKIQGKPLTADKQERRHADTGKRTVRTGWTRLSFNTHSQFCIFLFYNPPRHFMLPMVWDHSLECAWPARDTSLKKVDFSSPQNHQLSIGDCELLTPHAGMLTGWILCQSCAVKCSCWEFMSTTVLSCPEDAVSFEFSSISDSYNLPIFLFHDGSWALIEFWHKLELSICGWALQDIAALQHPVVSLYIKSCP